MMTEVRGSQLFLSVFCTKIQAERKEVWSERIQEVLLELHTKRKKKIECIN